MPKKPSWLIQNLAVAQVILSDRSQRRKFITGFLFLILILFVIGNWPLDKWLSKSLWRFLTWWGGTTFLCFMLILFAIYDALSVVKEEHEKIKSSDED